MKFYQRRSVAVVVLILAILGSSLYGFSKRPAELPEVSYGQWICDEAGLLDEETEATIKAYNQLWDEQTRAVIALATVEDIHGWSYEDYAADLGNKWGLGGNDMLLLMVKGEHYYVSLGDNIAYAMLDTQQAKLQSAIEKYYYDGEFDKAAIAFYRQADVVYSQAELYADEGDYGWAESSSTAGDTLVNLVIVLVLLFVLWSVLDRMRYSRYQRRYRSGIAVRPYYPIFWGRPRRTVIVNNNYGGSRPVRPSHTSSSSRQRSSGFGASGFGGGSRTGASRPSRTSAPRSSSGTRRGGGFGKSGFGGGKR